MIGNSRQRPHSGRGGCSTEQPVRGSIRDKARHENTRTQMSMLRSMNTVKQGKARSAPPAATAYSIGKGNQGKSTDTLFAQRIVYLPVVVTPAWEVRATEIAQMTAAATQKQGHRNCNKLYSPSTTDNGALVPFPQ